MTIQRRAETTAGGRNPAAAPAGRSARPQVLFVSELTAHQNGKGIEVSGGHLRRYLAYHDRLDLTWTLTPRASDPGAPHATFPEDVPHVWLPAMPSALAWLNRLPTLLRTLWRTIGRSDAVIVNAPSFPAIPALVVARLRRVPTVLFMLSRWQQLRNRPEQGGPLSRWVLRTAGDLAVRLADRTYTAGSGLLDELRPSSRRRAEAVVFPAVAEADLRHPARLRRAPTGRLVSVARFIATKRIDVLLEMVARLRREGHDVHLDLVGDGPEEERLRRRSEELGVTDAVTFHGWIDDWPRLQTILRRADAFVFASEDEGLPLSIMEAMALGVPVVTTDVGGVTDLLTDGRDALIVPRSDAELLAAATERLLTDPDLAYDLRRSALDTVAEHTREAWVERLVEELPLASGA